jgi:hypothetical protein
MRASEQAAQSEPSTPLQVEDTQIENAQPAINRFH